MMPDDDRKEQIELMGEKTIVLIAVEEMAELSKALLKNVNRGKNNIDAIFEEIGDVSNMLEFLKMIYGISDEKIWLYEDEKYIKKWKPRIEKMRAEKGGA
ncbi:MAG: hypothetical protein LBD94_02880 [Rickettsiales bacterium]|jgi:NTP pyrophosphatase (non-canonical NTP hydrolase)|nr:hypothetical protein [Rickettsiales bacterium]